LFRVRRQGDVMGLMDKIKGELVDIIEWFDDTRSTLAWRFPRYQNEIKNGAELIVREGQQAVFVYRGKIADKFGPGHYQLVTENLPILSTLQGWPHGFRSPFRSEVYFINTRPVTDLRWGTPSPVTVRDPDFKMVQVRANGLCVLRIADPEIFLREIIGTDSTVTTEEISELLRRIITLAFSDMIMATGMGAIELQGRQVQLSDKLRDFVQDRVDDEFGLKIDSVTMNITLPEEITQAMTRGVARGVEEGSYLDNVGPMDRLQQGAAAQAMVEAARNPGGGAGTMMGAGLGMALGQQMGQVMAAGQQGGQAQPQQPGYAPPAGPPPLPQAQLFHAELNGQAAGPFTIDQLRQYVTAGQLNPNSNVWANGMPNWVAAQTVPALAPLFAPSMPPPLPPPGAPA
jgi:membrane protease subunit (stomatin/prohibitin family)